MILVLVINLIWKKTFWSEPDLPKDDVSRTKEFGHIDISVNVEGRQNCKAGVNPVPFHNKNFGFEIIGIKNSKVLNCLCSKVR